MKISPIGTYPPNYDAIKTRFPFVEDNDLNIVFAYGDTLYNPSGAAVPHHLVVHETVHSNRQGNDPAAWWKRYLEDDDFRYEEEIAAYHAQYESLKRMCGNVTVKQWLVFTVKLLGGDMYAFKKAPDRGTMERHIKRGV